jgi:hypothetical protein
VLKSKAMLFSVALAVSTIVSAQVASDSFANDRILTPEHRALELQALKILQTPVGRAAYELGGRYLRNYAGVSGQDPVFDLALKKTALCVGMMAANADTNHPRIYGQAIPAHRIGKVDVPESSCGISNPDTIYRFIPVDGSSHYVITGHVAKNQPIENNFTLASFSLTTIGNLNGRDLKVEPDGSFRITIDPEPANGRPNHLQSRHDAFQMWIRDTLGDWSKEKPNRLSVQRVDSKALPPVDENGQVAMLGRYMAYQIFAMPAEPLSAPANTWKNPQILGGAAGAGGFLVTQAYSNGRFELKDDEAVLINLKLGFAGYAVVPVTNVWGSNDGVGGRLTGALNNFQAQRNDDGSYSFVVSKQDPGIRNWIDTGGLDKGLLYMRWAAFPKGDLSGKEAPSVSTRIVKLSEVGTLLPAAQHVDAATRQALIRERAERYVRRQQDE